MFDFQYITKAKKWTLPQNIVILPQNIVKLPQNIVIWFAV